MSLLITNKYPCDYCFKTYSKPSLLEQHLRTHLNIRPFKCTHLNCNKAFFRKSHLSEHIKAHQPPQLRQFECQHCGKRVNTSQHLKRHELTHFKSFKCTQCEESFYKNQQLKFHVKRVHENALDCDVCGKRFNRPYRLANHKEKIHGSVPGYQCEECAELLKTWSALQNHKKKSHPKLKCDFCGKLCVGESGLKMHMIVHGKNEEEEEDEKEKSEENSEEKSREKGSLKSEKVEEEEKGEKNQTKVPANILKYTSVIDFLSINAQKQEKPLACKYQHCDRRFKKEYDLQRHLQWHESHLASLKKKISENPG